jgi:hypothetical protein
LNSTAKTRKGVGLVDESHLTILFSNPTLIYFQLGCQSLQPQMMTMPWGRMRRVESRTAK